MYTRPPDRARQKIRIPENYSGSAFQQNSTAREYTIDRSPNPYSDMPPPAHPHLPPRADNTDQPGGMEEAVELFDESHINNADELQAEETAYAPIPTAKEKNEPKSLFSSIFPTGIASSSHFPFGHGIGSEEMLILAMMLLVYLSGEDHDNETLLMLGLLLFAG